MGPKLIRPQINWVVVITALLFAMGCSGGCGGCAGMEPIPGGFTAAKRVPNAAQLRVTDGALAKISADPASVIGPLVGGAMNGIVEFNVPASCGGSTEVCCVNNVPQPTCGPLAIDLVKRATDPALVLTPVQGASRMDMTIRARVKTKMNMQVKTQGVTCQVSLDSTRGSSPDVTITAQLGFPQDATVGTTRIAAANVAVALQNEDIQLSGSFTCSIADFFIGFVRGLFEDQIASQIQDTINEATCKPCESGQVAECGSSFATACTNKTCMVGGTCLQELGVSGRMRGNSIFANLSPGTTGALDLYEVLGGYADSNNGGLAMGLLGGMLPGGAPRDRCGPPATEPARPTIAKSAFFAGNTRPDTGATFDVGIGLHVSQLAQFAYAAYEGGFLCLTIGSGTVSQLSTDTLSLISRSLGNLNEGNSPMAVGLRPQSPPTIALGKNLFVDDGMGGKTLSDPLLDLRFAGMEIDFFAAVDDQYTRVFTVVADVQLPIGLQVTGTGELQPVLGDVEGAFTNISVKNSEAVTESPDQLASLFPTVLDLVLPQLSGGLSPLSLPALGGLELAVTAITATPQNVGGADNSYLSIFANLRPATMARPVDTVVSLGDIYQPDDAVMKNPAKWQRGAGPTIQLSYGDAPGLEHSYRIDGGSWSAWTPHRTQTIRSNALWLSGLHHVEVRAREIDRPETIDPTPAMIDVELGARTARRAPIRGFHGQPGEAGCNCETTGAGDASPFLLVLAFIILPMRRARRQVASVLRGARRLGMTTWLAAIALLPGCSCGSNPCGDAECLPGEVAHGGLGRWTSIAGDEKRVMVATYDQGLGDLVAIDVTDPANRKLVAVDGIPDGTPIYDPDGYRDGIEEPGDNVGAWTSIAFSNGHAMIAYQDRDAGTLKFAFETKPGSWRTMVVDDGDGVEVGRYASLAVDGEGFPSIAYIALGIDDGMGHRATELRIVRASSKEPSDAGAWGTAAVAATAPGSCGGLCGAGQACIAGAMAQTCTAVTSDCATACASGEACIAGTCTEAFEEPKVATIGSGTGLFVSLSAMADGRLAAVYYDMAARSLELALETAAASNEYAKTALHTGAGDRGLWTSAVVDATDTIHIAYQDAIGDQLLYTTWAGSPGTPEVVDDGQRTGDRTHPVGAATAIYLVNGTPTIAYQDGMTADVYIATKTGGAWSTMPLTAGPLLDGFSIAATTAHGGMPYLAWDSLDPAQSPPNSVAVQTP
ncbi:MAG: hypothetical protein H0T89_22535 [Deltaproteobacteria bacterium]|nr:hypothetical protein [Deltaproteobacteria bacterium]